MPQTGRYCISPRLRQCPGLASVVHRGKRGIMHVTPVIVAGMSTMVLLSACSSSPSGTSATTPPGTPSTAVASLAATPSTSPTPAASASPTAQATAAPTPSPTGPRTVEQAGEYYLDWVCWNNKATNKYATAVSGKSYSTLATKKYRDKALQLAKVNRTTAMALDAPPQPWPTNVAKPIAKVVAGFLGNVTALNTLADSRSANAATSSYAEYVKANNNFGVGPQQARMRLALPSAGSRKDGCKGRGSFPGAAPPSASASPSAAAPSASSSG